MRWKKTSTALSRARFSPSPRGRECPRKRSRVFPSTFLSLSLFKSQTCSFLSLSLSLYRAMVKSRKSVKHIRGKNTRTLMVKWGSMCVLLRLGLRRDQIKAILSLSLSFSLSCIIHVPDIRRKRKPLCLSVFSFLSRKLRKAPKPPSFFYLVPPACCAQYLEPSWAGRRHWSPTGGAREERKSSE